jgi:hypothetical protein
MAITCCYGCVPPKRTPTCHSTCPEYIKQKAKHDAEREARNEAKFVDWSIENQKADRTRQALRQKGIKYGE